MASSSALTTSLLLAAAQSALLEAGYQSLPIQGENAQSLTNARLFQNSYSVVMVVVFETWDSLLLTWPTYQSSTVEAMSTFLSKSDAKAADGYLALLTPGSVAPDDLPAANHIRTDTSRLRKLLGTADDIRTIADVRRVLSPLLPLAINVETKPEESSLDALPRILEQNGIRPDATKAIVDAFKENAPIMQRLHEVLHPQ